MLNMLKEKNKVFEYRIIAKDGTEKTLLSEHALFDDTSDHIIHLRDFLKEKSTQSSFETDSISTFKPDTIDSALYQIANNAFVAEDMEQFFGNIHKIINDLTYAENFFIALYSEGRNTISFPYIVDSASEFDADSLSKLPVETLNKTLTGYMLRTGKMLHANAELMDTLEAEEEINDLGEHSYEWLGFPLIKGKTIIGALVVQTYNPDVQYKKQDIELLQFVSQHVATALSRKQSDEALRESESKFREVLENSSVVTYKYNVQSNRYEYISPSAKYILGLTPRQVENNDIDMVKNRIHPDDLKMYKNRYKELLLTASDKKSDNHEVVEYRWQHMDDQTYHWFSDTRTIVINDENEPVAIIGSVRDITDIKCSEQELQETQLALQKIQELENIGVLAGGLAHDFNNMLTGLFGNIALAKIKLTPEHPVYVLMQKAEKSMDRATRLTQQLLTFSKGGEPNKEEVELTSLIQETVLFDLTGSNVKPVFDFSKSVYESYVDKGQIQQVISNLVINADQAMPDGGLITISVDSIDVKKGQLQLVTQGSYIRIKIQDQGIGMNTEVYEKKYDPYFSTKDNGSGLGLTTVFSIITKHDGYINVESKSGEGTTFIIYLPLIKVSGSTETDKPAPDINHASIRRILVMDDDEDILNLVCSVLEINNYEVTTTLDGKMMLEQYQQSMDEQHPFDVVIMDLTIPGGMGGKEAIVELLKIDNKAKCIVSSGYAEDPIMANFSDYGFKDAISKPFALDDLNQSLQKVILQL